MNRTIAISGLAAGLLLGLLGGAPARAGSVTLADSTGTTWGGEFVATVVDGFSGMTSGETFLTFCLERDEHVYFNGTVYTVQVSTAANHGGVGGPDPDPLDDMTAFLYSAFRAGTLTDGTGHLYGSGGASQDILDANDLQNAIWAIEQEISGGGTWMTTGVFTDFNAGYNRYTQLAYDNVHGPGGTWSGLGEVRVMQLYGQSGNWAQDQLMLDSRVPPLESAPLPASVVPGIALLIGLALVRARRRRMRPI